MAVMRGDHGVDHGGDFAWVTVAVIDDGGTHT